MKKMIPPLVMSRGKWLMAAPWRLQRSYYPVPATPVHDYINYLSPYYSFHSHHTSGPHCLWHRGGWTSWTSCLLLERVHTQPIFLKYLENCTIQHLTIFNRQGTWNLPILVLYGHKVELQSVCCPYPLHPSCPESKKI